MIFTQFSSAIMIIRRVFAIIRPPSKTDFSSRHIIAKWPHFGEWSTSHLLFDSWNKILTRFQKLVEKYSPINYLAWDKIWGNSGLYFFHKFGYYGWWPHHCEPPLATLVKSNQSNEGWMSCSNPTYIPTRRNDIFSWLKALH